MEAKWIEPDWQAKIIGNTYYVRRKNRKLAYVANEEDINWTPAAFDANDIELHYA